MSDIEPPDCHVGAGRLHQTAFKASDCAHHRTAWRYVKNQLPLHLRRTRFPLGRRWSGNLHCGAGPFTSSTNLKMALRCQEALGWTAAGRIIAPRMSRPASR